jgi:hypothetical protein
MAVDSDSAALVETRHPSCMALLVISANVAAKAFAAEGNQGGTR